MRGTLAWAGLAVVLSLSTGALAAPAPAKPASKSTKAPRKAPASQPEAAPVVAPPAPPPPPPAVVAPPPEPVAPPPPAAPAVSDALPGRMQGVGDVDVRLMLNADILLAFVSLGVGADVGVLRAGPGVLSLGAEIEAGLCFTVCFALDLATGWNFSHQYYSPHARVAYHFLPPNARSLEKVDLYGLVLGGITYTTTRISGEESGTAFDFRGRDVAPSFGLGAGAKFFVQERLYLGAEARLRFASGQYTYTSRVGNVSVSGEQSFWSLSGLNVLFFGGLRL